MRSTSFTAGAALLVTLAAASSLEAQQRTMHTITVESPTMQTGELMPRDYTPDGRNVSPPIQWSNLPPGTKQLAVLCEDHGAGRPPPWVHWIIYNIPATAAGLPEGIPINESVPMPPGLEGAVQGANGWNRRMYRGPANQPGARNHYTFVVYALDAELNLPPGLDRTQLMEAIEPHIIGRGELVPYYERQPMPETFPR